MTAPEAPGRWVRKEDRDSRSYSRGCQLCGSCYSDGASKRLCATATCRTCGSAVCYPGLSNQCPVCWVGILRQDLSWPLASDRAVCGYAGCTAPRVARAPRVGGVCKAHLGRATEGTGSHRRTLADAVAAALAGRGDRFVWVRADGTGR